MRSLLRLAGPLMAGAVVLAMISRSVSAAEPSESKPTASSSLDRVEVKVNGMACPFCAYGIEKKLKALPGAQDVKVDLGKGLATFEASSGAVSEQQIKQAIKDAGFTPVSINIKRESQ